MEVDENKSVRLKKLDALRAKGLILMASVLSVPCYWGILTNFQEGLKVVTAGRLMANRSMASSFYGFDGPDRRMQLFVKADNLAPDAYEMLEIWTLAILLR